MRAARLALWHSRKLSSRRATLRLGPEGHKILRFICQHPQVFGGASVHAASAAGVPEVHVDLSPRDSGQAPRVQRQLSLLPGRRLQVQDNRQARGRAPEPAAEVDWPCLTGASVAASGQRLLLRHAGRTLPLDVPSPTVVTINVRGVLLVHAPRDSDNPGLVRIVQRLQTLTGAVGRLMATAQAGGRPRGLA